jgi:hypothetical protein
LGAREANALDGALLAGGVPDGLLLDGVALGVVLEAPWLLAVAEALLAGAASGSASLPHPASATKAISATDARHRGWTKRDPADLPVRPRPASRGSSARPSASLFIM